MHKKDLINEIQERAPDVTKATAEKVVDAIIATADTRISCGADFAIPKVVRLSVTPRQARNGRNPKTGEAIRIPARKAVKARVASNLTEAANS